MVNFGPLAAEIRWRVWGTPANFNGFHILAALLHGTPVVGVSQTLRRWTESATYIRQGDHHGIGPHSCVHYKLLTFIYIFWDRLSNHASTSDGQKLPTDSLANYFYLDQKFNNIKIV